MTISNCLVSAAIIAEDSSRQLLLPSSSSQIAQKSGNVVTVVGTEAPGCSLERALSQHTPSSVERGAGAEAPARTCKVPTPAAALPAALPLQAGAAIVTAAPACYRASIRQASETLPIVSLVPTARRPDRGRRVTNYRDLGVSGTLHATRLVPPASCGSDCGLRRSVRASPTLRIGSRLDPLNSSNSDAIVAACPACNGALLNFTVHARPKKITCRCRLQRKRRCLSLIRAKRISERDREPIGSACAEQRPSAFREAQSPALIIREPYGESVADSNRNRSTDLASFEPINTYRHLCVGSVKFTTGCADVVSAPLDVANVLLGRSLFEKLASVAMSSSMTLLTSSTAVTVNSPSDGVAHFELPGAEEAAATPAAAPTDAANRLAVLANEVSSSSSSSSSVALLPSISRFLSLSSLLSTSPLSPSGATCRDRIASTCNADYSSVAGSVPPSTSAAMASRLALATTTVVAGDSATSNAACGALTVRTARNGLKSSSITRHRSSCSTVNVASGSESFALATTSAAASTPGTRAGRCLKTAAAEGGCRCQYRQQQQQQQTAADLKETCDTVQTPARLAAGLSDRVTDSSSAALSRSASAAGAAAAIAVAATATAAAAAALAAAAASAGTWLVAQGTSRALSEPGPRGGGQTLAGSASTRGRRRRAVGGCRQLVSACGASPFIRRFPLWLVLAVCVASLSPAIDGCSTRSTPKARSQLITDMERADARKGTSYRTSPRPTASYRRLSSTTPYARASSAAALRHHQYLQGPTLSDVSDSGNGRSRTTVRPNVTFLTYTCPEAYAEWYCLNGASCFALKIGESLLYNCECAEGYMGQRCEYKDLDRTYLSNRRGVLIETASIAGGVVIIILVMTICCMLLYVVAVRGGRSSYDRYDDSKSADTASSDNHFFRVYRLPIGSCGDFVTPVTSAIFKTTMATTKSAAAAAVTAVTAIRQHQQQQPQQPQQPHQQDKQGLPVSLAVPVTVNAFAADALVRTV